MVSCSWFRKGLRRPHPTLKLVGVRFLDDIESDSEFMSNDAMRNFQGGMNALYPMQGSVLKAIRLIDFGEDEYCQHELKLSHRKLFREWITKWQKVNVRLEEKSGELLTLLLSKASRPFFTS
jgi:hypothetical protein